MARAGTGERSESESEGPLASKTAPVHPASRGSEYLANERTFLAWIRTAVAIMSLGFVVDRFGLFLREIAIGSGAARGVPRIPRSFVVGDVMMAVGAGLAVLAGLRYRTVNRDIERGMARADRGMVLGVVVVVVLLAGAMLVIARPSP